MPRLFDNGRIDGMDRVMGLRSWMVLLLWQAAASAAPAQVAISVVDQAGQPVAGARIQLKAADGRLSTAATGQFGLTVPIDSVESLNVYQTPFLAEFGRFTAGLVSVETRRGGEKWKWELNDPFPEFRIRSWHLRGLKTATPRLNFEGPLIP